MTNYIDGFYITDTILSNRRKSILDYGLDILFIPGEVLHFSDHSSAMIENVIFHSRRSFEVTCITGYTAVFRNGRLSSERYRNNLRYTYKEMDDLVLYKVEILDYSSPTILEVFGTVQNSLSLPILKIDYELGNRIDNSRGKLLSHTVSSDTNFDLLKTICKVFSIDPEFIDLAYKQRVLPNVLSMIDNRFRPFRELYDTNLVKFVCNYFIEDRDAWFQEQVLEYINNMPGNCFDTFEKIGNDLNDLNDLNNESDNDSIPELENE